MYIKDRFHQIGLADFDQPIGLKMNPNNRWIQKAATIPSFAIEDRYAELFLSKTWMPAKPFRIALGSLIIQKQYGYSDRDWWNRSQRTPTISTSSACRATSRSRRIYPRYRIVSISQSYIRPIVRGKARLQQNSERNLT